MRAIIKILTLLFVCGFVFSQDATQDAPQNDMDIPPPQDAPQKTQSQKTQQGQLQEELQEENETVKPKPAKPDYTKVDCTKFKKGVIWYTIRDSIDGVRCAAVNKEDLNVQDEVTGMSALMQSSYRGNLDIVRFLISQGVDVNLKDTWGYTALSLAAMKSKTEVVKILLQVQGIDKSAQVKEGVDKGKTACVLAANNRIRDLIEPCS